MALDAVRIFGVRQWQIDFLVEQEEELAGLRESTKSILRHIEALKYGVGEKDAENSALFQERAALDVKILHLLLERKDYRNHQAWKAIMDAERFQAFLPKGMPSTRSIANIQAIDEEQKRANAFPSHAYSQRFRLDNQHMTRRMFRDLIENKNVWEERDICPNAHGYGGAAHGRLTQWRHGYGHFSTPTTNVPDDLKEDLGTHQMFWSRMHCRYCRELYPIFDPDDPGDNGVHPYLTRAERIEAFDMTVEEWKTRTSRLVDLLPTGGAIAPFLGRLTLRAQYDHIYAELMMWLVIEEEQSKYTDRLQLELGQRMGEFENHSNPVRSFADYQQRQRVLDEGMGT